MKTSIPKLTRSRRHRRRSGFSLMEVMIAMGIFFIALFTILGLVSQLLRNARAFQNKKSADAGMVHAYFLSVTNRVTEGLESGEFSDLAEFNGQYRDYSWEKETTFFASNGLWQVDYRVINRRHGTVESAISTLYFDPNTQQGGAGGVGGIGMPR
ncbi:MAG: prepilin-type N-terminal cleavage/methylation domain-containing protein [Verrucomicrobiota bacterium]